MAALLLVACNLIGLGLGAVLTGSLSDWLRIMGNEQPLTWALVITDLISLLTVPSFIWASVHIARQSRTAVSHSGNDSAETTAKT